MHSRLSLEAKSLKTEVEKLKEREDILLGFHNILGKSKKMRGLFHVIEEVARHNTSILIQGESGTGKELIARAIHRQSDRNTKAFVDVNCAAIPETLLESELFGYEAGAFTDARKRKLGLLEHASGGTMLLDEIGDMNIHIRQSFSVCWRMVISVAWEAMIIFPLMSGSSFRRTGIYPDGCGRELSRGSLLPD